VSVYAIPFLGDRLLAYGSRSSAEHQSTAVDANIKTQKQTSSKTQPVVPPSSDLLHTIASIRVPHSFFTHFYVTSLCASLFWLHQLYNRGAAVDWVIKLDASPSPHATAASMTLGQIWFLWTLLVLQGSRRLVESYIYSKPSKSTMHVAHWLIGLAFYLVDSVAIWIEGAPALSAHDHNLFSHKELVTTKALLGVTLFIVASIVQNRAHARLASLTSYQIPPGKLFRHVLCPHYTAEIIIYLCFAILAAPQGKLLNGTMVAALVFVVANLSVTAVGTRQWYLKHFDAADVGRRARLVPFLW